MACNRRGDRKLGEPDYLNRSGPRPNQRQPNMDLGKHHWSSWLSYVSKVLWVTTEVRVVVGGSLTYQRPCRWQEGPHVDPHLIGFRQAKIRWMSDANEAACEFRLYRVLSYT